MWITVGLISTPTFTSDGQPGHGGGNGAGGVGGRGDGPGPGDGGPGGQVKHLQKPGSDWLHITPEMRTRPLVARTQRVSAWSQQFGAVVTDPASGLSRTTRNQGGRHTPEGGRKERRPLENGREWERTWERGRSWIFLFLFLDPLLVAVDTHSAACVDLGDPGMRDLVRAHNGGGAWAERWVRRRADTQRLGRHRHYPAVGQHRHHEPPSGAAVRAKQSGNVALAQHREGGEYKWYRLEGSTVSHSTVITVTARD